MSEKTISKYTQDPRVAVFTWKFDDTMVSTAGTSKDFGKADLTSRAYDVIKLPPNSVVVGGRLMVKTAFDTAGYDVEIGDSADADRYLVSADVKSVGSTALTPTGYVNTSGLPIRVTIASDDACTAGEAMLFVEYIIDGRVDEIA